MLNPTVATITLPSPTATSFRLRYLVAGLPVAELVVAAFYNNAGSYIQPLQGLNALVPEANQGGAMTLIAFAINIGGESLATASPTDVIVVLPPGAPLTVVVS